MNKIVINYAKGNEFRRLVLDRDLPFSREVLAALLYLHSMRVISVKNILPIKEICISG